MDHEAERAFPDPWHDPDFAPRRDIWGKSERGSIAGGSWFDPEGRQRSGRLRVRIWVASLVLFALWLGLLLDPMVGPLLLAVLMAFGLTLAVIAGTMGLGMMGFGLFAAGDHVIAWLRRGTQWPEQ